MLDIGSYSLILVNINSYMKRFKSVKQEASELVTEQINSKIEYILAYPGSNKELQKLMRKMKPEFIRLQKLRKFIREQL